MICRTPAQSRACERGLWVGEEEVWSPRRLGCEQGAAPASLCSPGHRRCGGPRPQRPARLSWERTAAPRGIASELLLGRVHHRLTLFFLLTLDPLGGRESRTARDCPAVLRGPRLREWPPGPHPEQRGGKARWGKFLDLSRVSSRPVRGLSLLV